MREVLVLVRGKSNSEGEGEKIGAGLEHGRFLDF